ncbi:arylamine N-acetyltransferase, pineal gland isozyme NAT-10-like isoform X1 [Latimeria chalumnae]|uniref:arylamine N-acetyltransferase n=1 Tax=Latimeria chalumnae TaxID=7897 RepID=H3AI17_LATCH|nr:PREDICTED: arylamine N-acetyltransferase, pineal gland isozyme NAT-10-like [Latimeria chalumnae]|eukprot:XP_006009854.1 PREDICTED: arylamine N-acetyltransferase, pineal gland isozyme NAT-10-like [Latimeria chalumnae]
MNVSSYLARIGYEGSTDPSLETLRKIHTHHLLSVPFESLSIHCGEKITLDLLLLHEKIVKRRRGGFCCELNGLFSWLLKELGYEVTMFSGQVRNRFTQLYGPPNDHLVMLVDLDGQQWLCDIGFGSGFRTPLLLKAGLEQPQPNGNFRLCQDGGTWILESRLEDLAGKASSEWLSIYKFTLEECQLEDFVHMCEYHQTSPSSVFFCKSFCTLHLPNGMITYMGRRLIETDFAKGPNATREVELEEEEIPNILKEKFGIMLANKLIPKDDSIVPPPPIF